MDEVDLLCEAIKNIGEPVGEDGHPYVSVYDIPAFEAAAARMLEYYADYYDSFKRSPNATLSPINNEYKEFLETLAGPYGKVIFAAYCQKHDITERITWGNKENAGS